MSNGYMVHVAYRNTMHYSVDPSYKNDSSIAFKVITHW